MPSSGDRARRASDGFGRHRGYPPPHALAVHLLPLGRHPGRLRARRRQRPGGDHRRPPVPRRPERGAAPHDAERLPGSQRRAAQGLREMLEQLRRKRRDTLEKHDLGGIYDDIAQELRDIVDMERGGARRPRPRGPRQRRPASPGDHRGGHPGAPDAARHAAPRPRRPGAAAAAVRVHVVRGPRAVRGAHGPAPPAAHAELLQPDGRGDAGRQPRADAAHEGHALGAEPDAGAA